MWFMLTCPLCLQPLTAADTGLGCPASHRFDRARQGYFNLLPVQFKRSRDPGDNPDMVAARRRFLDGGAYRALLGRLVDLALARSPASWLDIGCGEGYYTAGLADALPEADGYALDISRDAVKRACRRAPRITWLVASMARIPLADRSLDLVVSVFSPLAWREAARVLAPGGRLVRLGPAQAHLLELRAALYDEVRDYSDDKHLVDVPEGMRLVHAETSSLALELQAREDRADLLAMTPHGWRASAERRAAVIAAPLTVTVAGRFDCFERD